ncbi:MAG: class I adenylate-forming enzyme family protein, partial [Acidimicrobiales bacterium]
LTSSTTGRPKLVNLTYRALEQSLLNARHYEAADHSTPRLHDRAQLCVLPLVHISGLWPGLKGVVDGRPTALLERFDVTSFVEAVRRHHPSVCGLTPTAVRMLLDAQVRRDDLASLWAIRVGTAPTPPGLVDHFLAVYDIPLLTVYGATEFAGAVAGWTLRDFHQLWEAKWGSVGRVHPGVELRVIDPQSGAPLPCGEIGVLEARGAQLEGVGGATGDTWVRTTDLGSLDGDGFLFVTGRTDDVIVRGGFKVSPTKVAAVLQEHPAVREAGVTGVDDARLGAVPVAAVELANGRQVPSEDELLAYVRERLAPYEVPRSIRVVDALPRTPSMKVSQPALRLLFT